MKSELVQFSARRGKEILLKADLLKHQSKEEAHVAAWTCLLHYADSIGLDALPLSRMAEMHFIDERGEVVL